MTNEPLPVLYSFRRCPYAMRARKALIASETPVELREVNLKDKPKDMVDASPKATVPVLVLPDGTVIEQSLDIMLWALDTDDPLDWLEPGRNAMFALIAETEDPFKQHLDRYKYHTRYDNADPFHHRGEAVKFLEKLNGRLEATAHLFGARPSLADHAIFPFIRQFANTDRAWFDTLPLPDLQNWLEHHLVSPIFQNIMKKQPFWTKGDAVTLLAE